MTGWFISCFTCGAKVSNKGLVRRNHLNHEVDWVRKKDGARLSFVPDSEIPKTDVEDGF